MAVYLGGIMWQWQSPDKNRSGKTNQREEQPILLGVVTYLPLVRAHR